MNWFRKHEHEQSKDVVRKTQDVINRIESEHAAVTPISEAVLKATCACADATKSWIQVSNEKDRKEVEVLVHFEFLYFFMHLACRLMFAAKGDAMRTRVQDIMGPLLVLTEIETIFGHWPQNLKDRIQSEVYEKLNAAELEYGSCKGLLPEENPLKGNGLFPMLGRNVASLCGSEMNPATITFVICEAADALKESGLTNAVGTAGEF